MIYIGGYWIGRNKGCLDNDILIGKKGHGGIPLKDFIAGKHVEIGSAEND